MRIAALSVLFGLVMAFTGCGGGGGGGAPAGGGTTKTPSGSVVVRIDQGSSLQKIPDVYITKMRVVVNNPYLKIDGVAFRSVIADTSFGGDPVTFSLPAVGGYTFEVVTYVEDPDFDVKRLRSYGSSGLVRVIGDGTTDVPITLNPITASLNVNAPDGVIAPTIVESNGYFYTKTTSYPVTATLQETTPLQPGWSLRYQLEPFTAPFDRSSPTPGIAVTNYLRPPTVYTSTTLYLQAQFYIKKSLLDQSENNLEWVFNTPYPETPFEEPQMEIPLIMPQGGGTIVITPPV